MDGWTPDGVQLQFKDASETPSSNSDVFYLILDEGRAKATQGVMATTAGRKRYSQRSMTRGAVFLAPSIHLLGAGHPPPPPPRSPSYSEMCFSARPAVSSVELFITGNTPHGCCCKRVIFPYSGRAG